MVLTYSYNADLNRNCPDFSLLSVDDKKYCLKDFADCKVLLVAFICNHCPYVMAIEDRLIDLAKKYPKDQFQMIAICSNDRKSYPDDSKENLYKRWQEKNYGFVYLVDESQQIAKNFGALCTPDFFLYDQNRKLKYQGQLDDNWKDESLVKERSMEKAIDLLIQDKKINFITKPSLGCSIKWK